MQVMKYYKIAEGRYTSATYNDSFFDDPKYGEEVSYEEYEKATENGLQEISEFSVTQESEGENSEN